MLHLDAWAQKLPTIVPPSPQSKVFQRYGDFPVNHSTGIPDISIPLYTVRSGELEMPVVLRYHASGIKPNDPDMSNIGAGWTLDVGGLISRTVEGRADELFRRPTPFLSALEINQDDYNHILYLTDILTNRNYDVQYDRFSYSFGGKNGNFAIEDDGSGNFTAHLYPYLPYKVNVATGAPTSSTYYRSITGIDITDDNGNVYQFGYNNVEKAIVSADVAPTGWFLEKIRNANASREITVEYEAIPSFTITTLNRTMELRTDPAGDNGINVSDIRCDQMPSAGVYGYCDVQGSAINYETKSIKKVLFAEGSLVFNLSSSKRLVESIVVYNKANEVIRTITFNRDLFPGSSTFNRLNAVVITGKTAGASEEYTFTYNLQHPVADNQCLLDQWGYCRGESTNPNLCMQRTVQYITHAYGMFPSGTVMTGVVGDAVFTPNEDYMKRYVLEKIRFPTGGTAEFRYEAKRYLSGQTTEIGGGLRIKEIISSDGVSEPVTKSYEYEPGLAEHSLTDPSNFTSCSFTILQQCYSTGTTPIYYSFRNRVLSNGWNGLLGSNNVTYGKVTEYIGTSSNNTGKNVYTYSYENSDDVGPTSMSGPMVGAYVPSNYKRSYKNWGNGLLTKKEVFRNNGGSYLIIEDASYDYDFVNIKTLNGLYVSQVVSYNGYSNSPTGAYSARNDLSTNVLISKSRLPFGTSINNQSIVTGAYYLKNTVENKYEGGVTSTITTTYSYGNSTHYYPTSIEQTLSNGESKVKTMAYVDEFAGTAPYTQMKNLNIVAPAIETKTFLRNSGGIDRQIGTERINYADLGGNLIKPANQQFALLAQTPENRVEFSKYDQFGNILEMSKTNDVKLAFIWRYNNSYPVAQITNATESDVFYTSFEEGDGNSAAGDSKTGLYSKTGGYSLAVTGLSTGNYRLSYWQKSGSVWSFQQSVHTVVGGTFIMSLSGQVDEVRFHPDKAQMTTFTYDPLIGMTSQMEVNGRSTHYEYDELGRLKIIRDENGQIIKVFDYKMQQSY